MIYEVPKGTYCYLVHQDGLGGYYLRGFKTRKKVTYGDFDRVHFNTEAGNSIAKLAHHDLDEFDEVENALFVLPPNDKDVFAILVYFDDMEVYSERK